MGLCGTDLSDLFRQEHDLSQGDVEKGPEGNWLLLANLWATCRWRQSTVCGSLTEARSRQTARNQGFFSKEHVGSTLERKTRLSSKVFGGSVRRWKEESVPNFNKGGMLLAQGSHRQELRSLRVRALSSCRHPSALQPWYLERGLYSGINSSHLEIF